MEIKNEISNNMKKFKVDKQKNGKLKFSLLFGYLLLIFCLMAFVNADTCETYGSLDCMREGCFIDFRGMSGCSVTEYVFDQCYSPGSGLWCQLPSDDVGCDDDGDGYHTGDSFPGCSLGGDCDDTDPNTNLEYQYCVDGDGDGYGAGSPQYVCSETAPSGYSTNCGDCDDSDGSKIWDRNVYVDGDEDGWGAGGPTPMCLGSIAPEGYSFSGGDCDDSNSLKTLLLPKKICSPVAGYCTPRSCTWNPNTDSPSCTGGNCISPTISCSDTWVCEESDTPITPPVVAPPQIPNLPRFPRYPRIDYEYRRNWFSPGYGFGCLQMEEICYNQSLCEYKTSVLKNQGADFILNMSLSVDYFTNGNWSNVSTLYNQQVSSGLLSWIDLSQLWNGLGGWDSTGEENGTYRAKVALLNPQGRVIRSQTGKLIEDTYNFTLGTLSSEMDTTYPIFSDYWDNNATLNGSGVALFNVTILNANGSAWLDINGSNYTAENLTSSVYNVSISLTNGTYSYQWWAYGNGSSHLINNSGFRYYALNNSVGGGDTTPPQITINSPVNGTYDNRYIYGIYDLGSNENLSYCNFSVNNQAASTMVIFNNDSNTSVLYPYSEGVTYTPGSFYPGTYNISYWCNDTSGNINNSEMSLIVVNYIVNASFIGDALTKYDTYYRDYYPELSYSFGEDINLTDSSDMPEINGTYAIEAVIQNYNTTLGNVTVNYTLDLLVVSFANQSAITNLPGADIVFVLDESRSMQGHVNDIWAYSNLLTDRLDSMNIPYRLAVVGFGPTSRAYGSFGNTTYFKSNVAQVVNNILSSYPGVGIEYGLTALNDTLSYFHYSPFSKKFFIILTDEDSDDCGQLVTDPIDNGIHDLRCQKLNQTITTMNQNNVTVFTVVPDPICDPIGCYVAPEYNGSSSSISRHTNGSRYDLFVPASTLLDELGLNVSGKYPSFNLTDFSINMTKVFSDSEYYHSSTLQELVQDYITNHPEYGIPLDLYSSPFRKGYYSLVVKSVKSDSGISVPRMISSGLNYRGYSIGGYESYANDSRIFLNFTRESSLYFTTSNYLVLNITLTLNNSIYTSNMTVKELINHYNGSNYSSIPTDIYINPNKTVVNYSVLISSSTLYNHIVLSPRFVQGNVEVSGSDIANAENSYVEVDYVPFWGYSFIKSYSNQTGRLLMKVQYNNSETWEDVSAPYNSSFNFTRGVIYDISRLWSSWNSANTNYTGEFRSCVIPMYDNGTFFSNSSIFCNWFYINQSNYSVYCGASGGGINTGLGMGVNLILAKMSFVNFSNVSSVVYTPFLVNETYNLTENNKSFSKELRYYFPGSYDYNISYHVSSGVNSSCYGNFSYSGLNATSDIRTDKDSYDPGEVVNLYASTTNSTTASICYPTCIKWGYT